VVDRWAAWLERDVLRVTGPESGTFLQGQLSQDVERLVAGTTAWSWVLAPTGKVDALVRVTRVDTDTWLLDTDSGWAPSVVARLERFKLRTKVEFEALDWRVLAVRGAGWDPTTWDGSIAVEPWPQTPGWDIFDPSSPAVDKIEDSTPLVGADEVQVARIRSLVPAMGADLTSSTIPEETGLVDRTVSFEKGCYTGQELVARIDSRGGHVARRLRFLQLSGPCESGVALVDGDREAGVVTSVGHSSLSGWEDLGWVGLGYLKRGFDPPLSLTAGNGGPGVEVPTDTR
jgi:tRNA-modifying protein YgfZ